MKETQKGYLMCFTGVITWSFSEIIVKLLGGVGFISLSFLRFFIGGTFLLMIILIQKENTKDLLTIIWKYKWLMIISAAIGLGISNMIYFLGLQFTNANVGSALYVTYPIFISIYSVFLLNERSNLKLKTIGYLIGITGTLILMTNFQFELLFQPQNIFGNILLVFAAILFAFQSVIGKLIFKKSKEITNIEIKYTTTSFLLACIPIIIVLFFTPEINTFLMYSLSEWIIILILGIVSTGFGLYIFYRGIKKIELSKGISLALLKPVISTIFCYIILEELPTIALIVSIPMIMVAVFLINRPIKNNKK
ncbi:MAG: DMT family transporter [Candidatus Helarchaeota archaeon]